MQRLSKNAASEICRLAKIPGPKRRWFLVAVEKSVASYKHSKLLKREHEAVSEIHQIEKLGRSCLRLLDRKIWRPREFEKKVETISSRLSSLTMAAHAFLESRNVTIVMQRPASWTAPLGSSFVVDPACFSEDGDRIDALIELVGAVAGTGQNPRGRGQPQKYLEQALYHMIAFAYVHATGRQAYDTSRPFMAACHAIRSVYMLDGWNPESLGRLVRLRRASDQTEEA